MATQTPLEEMQTRVVECLAHHIQRGPTWALLPPFGPLPAPPRQVQAQGCQGIGSDLSAISRKLSLPEAEGGSSGLLEIVPLPPTGRVAGTCGSCSSEASPAPALGDCLCLSACARETVAHEARPAFGRAWSMFLGFR